MYESAFGRFDERELNTELGKMIEQVLESKRKRIEEHTERLQGLLLAKYLYDNGIGGGFPKNRDEQIEKTTNNIKYLKENLFKFDKSLYEMGFLVLDEER